jgi:hypothetical protein
LYRKSKIRAVFNWTALANSFFDPIPVNPADSDINFYKTLLLTQWTAVNPESKQKHF